MQISTRTRVTLAVVSVAALLAAGYAVAQSPAPGSGDVVADRQRLMKLNGASLKDLGDKLKAGQIEAMAVNAETLAINAQHIPSLFPKGSKTDKSYVKVEAWEKWDDFVSASKNLETLSIKVRDAAASKDPAAVQAAMTDFGKNACGTCHTPFRTPKT